MTDITDQEKAVRRIMQQMQGYVDNAAWYTGRPAEWLRDLREVFPAPTPALADEIRGLPDFTMSGDNCINDCHDRADTLATRVEQMEYARNTLEQQRDYWRDSERQAVTERDEARAEVDHLKRDLAEAYKTRDARDDEVDRLRAEVERLTAERDEKEVLDAINAHYTTTYAPHPDPADVNPGEAWEVIATDPAKSFGGTTSYNTVAFRMADRWIVCRQGYQTPLVVPDDYIRLVRRHVPAPRVITNPDDLDQAKRDTIIRDARGVVCSRDSMGDAWTTFTSLANQRPHIVLPATVLWEPATP